MTINDVEVNNMQDEIAERFKRASGTREERIQWISSLPLECPCEIHLGEMRPLQKEASYYNNEATYGDCPVCAFPIVSEKLHSRGVPGCLMHASLDNWTPSSEQEKEHLEKCREFAKMDRGFLLLLGGVGSGKSHLAVGIMREIGKGYFVKQSTLLRSLRETYKDSKAADPVSKCQESRLLILDEMGISAGGKDEFPMLSEILDYRYSEAKQTILTSNLDRDGLAALLGERIGDRLRECAFAILSFGGASHRRNAREKYFTMPSPQPVDPEKKPKRGPNI